MIGTILILTPTIGWAWPAVLPAATAAAAALGYKQFMSGEGRRWLRGRVTRELESIRRVVVPLDSVLAEVVAEDLGTEERLSFKKDDILLVFRKDGRGKFFIEVSGPKEVSALNLKTRGEEFAREVVRRFAYHKMVEQIHRRGAAIVDEENLEDGRLRLRIRQWR